MRIIELILTLCLVSFASAALAADLSAYNGAYPFDEIGDYAFFENLAVQEAIDDAAGDGTTDWIDQLSVGTPIQQQNDGLIAIVCEQHNCPGNNAAVAISLTGVLIAACLYSEDGEHGAAPGKVRWVAPHFDKELDNATGDGCPHDASEFLDAYSKVLK